MVHQADGRSFLKAGFEQGRRLKTHSRSVSGRRRFCRHPGAGRDLSVRCAQCGRAPRCAGNACATSCANFPPPVCANTEPSARRRIFGSRWKNGIPTEICGMCCDTLQMDFLARCCMTPGAFSSERNWRASAIHGLLCDGTACPAKRQGNSRVSQNAGPCSCAR